MFARGMKQAKGVVLLLTAVVPVPIGIGTVPPASPGAPPWWPDDGVPSISNGDLRQFIDALQQSVERLTHWVQLFQQTASQALARAVSEFPGILPDEADLTGLVAQIRALPASLRHALEVVRDKLQTRPAPGSVHERHHAYVESNPALVHEAAGIAEADEVVAGGMVQQAAASQATALQAAAVARDLRPEAVGIAARDAGDAMVSAAHDLPSSRAGIELLVAGMGAGLHQQAEMGAAQSDRLTILVQQTAQVSQQVEALAATTGALTLRQVDRDRRALEGALGLADAVAAGAQLLQDILTQTGNPADSEPRLDPLY
jgi:hypothetical protein